MGQQIDSVVAVAEAEGGGSGPSPADYEVGLESLSQWQLAWRKFKKHRLALIGLGILGAFVLIALIGPLLMPYSFDDTGHPDQIVYKGRPPSIGHFFGETGGLQRDVLVLVVNGAKWSLLIGFSSMAIGVLIGTIVGSIAGYVGGFVDNVLMRIVDIMLSLPLLFVILVAARFFASARDNVWTIIIIFGLFGWMGVARLVRSVPWADSSRKTLARKSTCASKSSFLKSGIEQTSQRRRTWSGVFARARISSRADRCARAWASSACVACR